MHRKILLLSALLALVISTPSVRAEHKKTFCRGDYYSLEERYQAYEDLAATYPDLVTIEKIGDSARGRPIMVIKIAISDGKSRPEALITGNIHANEFLGGRMAFEAARRLAEGYNVDPWITLLLDRMDFYIVPLLNPDGFKSAYRHVRMGFTIRRDSARRVDLNRNFPYPQGTEIKDYRAGSNIKWHPNYRGPNPLSEPETSALTNFVEGRKFFVAINFHTSGGHLIYPYAYAPDEPPDVDIFKAMGKALNDNQPRVKYKAHQAFTWYQTVGSLDDWLYRKFGILSVTVELAKPDKRLYNPLRAYNPFWWYNPVNIQEWVDNDLDASLHVIETAYESTGGEPRPVQPTEWVLPK